MATKFAVDEGDTVLDGPATVSSLKLPASASSAAPTKATADEASLLRSIEMIAPVLQRGAAQSDVKGCLVDESARALQTNNFWRLKLCREMGGLELPIVTQIRCLAALAAVDTSSAWCTMIANNAVAALGATMPQAAIESIFSAGVPACSIVVAPGGIATAKEGGYVLNGTWRLASSIHHAEWVHATALIERDPSRILPLAIRARDVELLDTWNVVGLGGTGSKDFKLTNYFLPSELTGNEHNPYGQIRGERRYDLVDLEHLESYEHLAFALGVGRRALHELRALLAKPSPGRYIADREVVQSQLGQAVVKMQAVEALAYSLYARVDAAAIGSPQIWLDTDRHLPRALAVWATQLALECVQLAFHRSGLASLHRPNILEKLLRDMSVAAIHVVVEDSAFPSYAQHLIETGASLELSRPVSNTI